MVTYKCSDYINVTVFIPHVNIAGVDALRSIHEIEGFACIKILYYSQSSRTLFRSNYHLISTEFNKQYQIVSELGFQEFIHELRRQQKSEENDISNNKKYFGV